MGSPHQNLAGYYFASAQSAFAISGTPVVSTVVATMRWQRRFCSVWGRMTRRRLDGTSELEVEADRRKERKHLC